MSEIEKSRVVEIVQLHGEIGAYLRMTLDKAIRIGELLAEQKADLPHGAFEGWVRRNAPFNVRTAQRYMQCYRGRDLLKNDNVSLLSDAHKLLVNTGAGLGSVVEAERQEAMEARVRDASPEMYAEREKVLFHPPNDFATVCLALGPDWEHPYVETADFILSDAVKIDRSWTREKVFDYVLEAYNRGQAVCTKAGTWGNYFNPKMDIGCTKHFIRNYNGNTSRDFWFKSGLQRFPREAFKTDLSIIEVDPRTEEDKAQQRCNFLRRDVERQEKETEKVRRKLAQAEWQLEEEFGQLVGGAP